VNEDNEPVSWVEQGTDQDATADLFAGQRRCHDLAGLGRCADVPFHAIVPLTPTLCLAANAPSGTITRQNLADINHAIKSNSRDYYFGHDLAACPM
jgi:hypothetical protein